MQETWIRSLVWEDSTCHGAAKPTRYDCWACALEPRAATSEPTCPGARVPQEEPSEGKARTLLLESNSLPTAREKPGQQRRPGPAQVKK